jgi:hypothetical protein
MVLWFPADATKRCLEMADSKNNSIEVRGTDLSPNQLSHAGDFLALVGWNGNEPARTTRRVDIARLLAWYGALRYQAGQNASGSLENPWRLINKTPHSSFEN